MMLMWLENYFHQVEGSPLRLSTVSMTMGRFIYVGQHSFQKFDSLIPEFALMPKRALRSLSIGGLL